MNKLLQDKDDELLWHPYSSLQPNQKNIVITSAKGVYLHTSDGRKIIDAISSWWVNIHGHAHPYMNTKLTEQASTLEHVIFAGFTHAPAIALAERLIAILPGNQKRLFLSDNGSTAVEVAIKLAIQYQFNKNKKIGKIIALEGAFHGDTFGAMSISGRGIFTKPFDNFLFEVEHIPFPEEGKEEHTVNAFENCAKNNSGSIFIYEPLIQGASGMRIYKPETLESLLKIAQKYEITCIADEVMTGFGRTGKLFASEYITTPPDIICLSKAITGGYMPLGATTCNQKIESAFLSKEQEKTFFHGHSYTGNPLACALANASLDLLLTTDYQNKIEVIHNSHLIFKQKIKNLKTSKKIGVLGTIISIEITTFDTSGYTNPIRDKIYNFFLEKNILLRPLGNIIYVIPPYTIEALELNTIYNAIEELLRNIDN
jgi:adenosylmethionine-8-amino-7-oxononanoate aminotransferase